MEDGPLAVFSTISPFGRLNIKSRLWTGSLVPRVTVILTLAFESEILRFAFKRDFAFIKRRGHAWGAASLMLDNVRRTILKEIKARRMCPSYNGVSCGWLLEGRFSVG